MRERKHIILAPHADDEIIGCYEALITGKVQHVIFPVNNQAALKESEGSAKVFGFTTDLFTDLNDLYRFGQFAKNLGGLIFLPDPVYEFHPEHKRWGGLGRSLGNNVVYYSTNMNAPYLHEVYHSTDKKNALDVCYPGKKSLWEFDHRYFLFEGHTMWNISSLL